MKKTKHQTTTSTQESKLMRTIKLVSFFAGLGAVVVAKAESPRPNVVFILADDLGWRDTGCYGSTFYETPNIDRIAARGMRFTQAYSASPLCSPTRASIMTGQYPARVGITWASCHLPLQLEKRLDPGTPAVRVLNADHLTRLKPDYFTLAEALKANGYATAHFGKWHLGHGSPYEPKDQGFDRDFPHTPAAPGPAGGYFAPWSFIKDPPLTAPPGEHIDDRMSVEAAKYIRENKDRPFYLNFWLYSVHAPFNARQDCIDYFQTKVNPDNPQRNPLYAAMVKHMDDSVGRLLKALDDAGVADNTIIVFTSDNGGYVNAPKETDPAGYEKAPVTSCYPLRRGKGSLYEGGTRVPCIMVWPGRTQAGAVVDALFQSVDFYPTLLAMCGIAPRDGLQFDGLDQSAVLLGQSGPRDRVFCHFPHGGLIQSPMNRETGYLPGTYVRKGEWKLIRFFADNEDGSDRLELYNLKEDIGEEKNLAATYPERANELNQLMDEFLQDTQAVLPKLNPSFKPPSRPSMPHNNKVNVHGGKSVQKEGLLIFERESEDAFLGLVAGEIGANPEFRVRIKSTGGKCRIAWFPSPVKTSGNPPSVSLEMTGGWQELCAAIPAQPGQSGILRFYFPAQNEAVEVDWVEIKSGKGTQRWDFSSGITVAEPEWQRDRRNLLMNFNNMYQPCVVETGGEYRFKMWFFGWATATANPGIPGADAIYHARSADLITWEVYCKDGSWDTTMNPARWKPVLHASTRWYEAWHVGDPSVVLKDGTFYMAYSATSKVIGDVEGYPSTMVLCVMGAVSKDGIQWKKTDQPLLIREGDSATPKPEPGRIGDFHRPCLRWENSRWRLWFDYWLPGKSICMGYAENENEFSRPFGFSIRHDLTKPLLTNWPNPEVIRIGNTYHSFADPSGYPIKPGESKWKSRQLREAVSSDGLSWRMLDYIPPDQDADACQIPQVLIAEMDGKKWLYLFYATQIGTAKKDGIYHYQYDRIRAMRRLIKAP